MVVWGILRQTLQVKAFLTVIIIAVEYLKVLTRGALPETHAATREIEAWVPEDGRVWLVVDCAIGFNLRIFAIH